MHTRKNARNASPSDSKNDACDRIIQTSLLDRANKLVKIFDSTTSIGARLRCRFATLNVVNVARDKAGFLGR